MSQHRNIQRLEATLNAAEDILSNIVEDAWQRNKEGWQNVEQQPQLECGPPVQNPQDAQEPR